MEFFDFTGTNDEEKAEALNIIGAHESSGVEFFLGYNTRNAYANSGSSGSTATSTNNNNANHIKPAYVNVNGIVSPQNSVRRDGQQQQQQLQQQGGNAFNYPRGMVPTVNPAISSGSNQAFVNSQSNWAISMQPNGASPPVVCAAPQYIYQQAAPPYFVPSGPHNPSMYAVPQMSAAAAMSAQSVNHQNSIKDMKPTQMPSNASSLIITSSSSVLKNSSKSANTNVPNCDIQSSFYMPSPHYPESPQLVENSRLSASAISVSGDGSAIMSEPGAAMATNGSPVGVPPPPPHMSHPHHQHPGPYGPFPPHAFHPPAAALFQGQFSHSPFPVYFFHSDNASYPYYAAPHHFAAAPNMSIQAAGHPQPNVITSPNSSQLDLANPQSNQHPPMGASAASSATTLSNLSSSVSASSASIAAAYQGSEGSQSGTPTSTFDQADDCNVSAGNLYPSYDTNESTIEKTNSNAAQDALPQQTYETSEQVPLPLSNQSLPRQSPRLSSSNVPSSDTPPSSSNLPSFESPSSIVNSSNSSSDSSTMLTAPAAPEPTSEATKPLVAESTSELPDNSTQDSNLLFVRDATSPTAVPTEATNQDNVGKSTWAAKLFGSVASADSGHKASSPAQAAASPAATAAPSAKQAMVNGDIDGKSSSSSSSMTNGDFPELGAFKTVHSQANIRGHKTRHIVDDVGKQLTVISMNEDPVALKLAKRLRDTIHLKHSLPTIMPCGLINRGNWCYVNATLQALLACPPFYNLMREISETNNIFRAATSTPIIDNFARYFGRFLPTDYKRQMKTAGHTAISYLEEILNNDPFEPMCIYDTLKHIGMIKNDAQRGHQEDAEEFLSSVLNGLHEEMIKLSNTLSDTENGQKEHPSSAKTNGFGLHDLPDNDGLFVEDDVSDPNDNLWHEVGTSKHKALPTRSAKVISTAITEIFGGSTLDVRTVNSSKDNSSGNRQPFFALQLDIKPPNIRNLEEALKWQTRRETIHGYTCSKTKQVVEAYSQMFLETVPPILILHLKLFEYDIETGAGRKVLKRIDFGENFEIPSECFPGKKDSRQVCKKYKLLAVVYHSGAEAVKGHYITDVYHLGLNQWLRCDDANIKVISISQVLATGASGSTMVPYLLFYRRQDTLNSTSSSNANAPHYNSVAHVNGGGGSAKVKQADTTAPHQLHHAHNQSNHHHQHQRASNSHNKQSHDVAINTSNKFSSISRQNH